MSCELIQKRLRWMPTPPQGPPLQLRQVCYRGPVFVRKSDISLFYLFWLRWAACGILETWPEIEVVPSALGRQTLKALDGQGSPHLQHLISSWAPCTFITLDAFWWGVENQMITQGWLFKKETPRLQRWRKERKGGDEESRVRLAEDKCTRPFIEITETWISIAVLLTVIQTMSGQHLTRDTGKLKSTQNFLSWTKKVKGTETTFPSSTLFTPEAPRRGNWHFNFCWVPGVGRCRLHLRVHRSDAAITTSL